MFAKGVRQKDGALVDLRTWTLPAADSFADAMRAAVLKCASEAIEHVLESEDVYMPIKNGDEFGHPGKLVALVVVPLGNRGDYDDEPKWAINLEEVLDPAEIDEELHDRLRDVLSHTLAKLG